TPIRDYIHVADLARAHVIAMNRMLRNQNKDRYEIFNLGTGNGFTVLEVIKSFEKVSGIKLNHKIVQRRPGDVEKVWADTTHANEELGWKAEKGLDEMMLSAWNWEKSLQAQKNKKS
ncbi:MAG: GDP-mannose 4,6-dehydratase, partial [Bacteroidales bacterium]